MVRNIFKEISEQYSKLWDSRDTRLSHMPFMQSPLPMVLLVAGYLFIVQTGKKWMEHRQPLPIERLVIAYNFVQIIINSVLVLVVTHYIFIVNQNFSFKCEPANFATDGIGIYEAYVGYSYFILKLVDYLDTVFFILRKKWAQVSFLHVYHHVMTSVVAYLFMLYAPAGQATLFVYLNCFVHAVMYTYYLLSISKPMGIIPSVTMKKNITRLQIIQSYIMVLHFGHGLVIPGHDCGYPKILSFLGSTQNLFMAILFTNFYRRAYGKKTEQRQKIE